MENALVRGRDSHPAVVGDDVLIGPHAHVNGSTIEAGRFIATGASLFPGSVLGAGTEVRINGVVQVNTRLPEQSLVPIGRIAVGDPSTSLSPDRHDEIWETQQALDFPGTVYGAERDTSATERRRRQSEYCRAHRDDVVRG